MKKSLVNTEVSGPDWKGLYRAGGAAALLAGVIFRRNLGVEVSLFAAQKAPQSVPEVFALFQENRLLALTYLNIFDVLNYLLLALMFLALYALLRRTSPGAMTAAVGMGLLGIGIYAASNTALSVLALSDQYAAAASEPQRSMLEASGQALMALNRFTSAGAHPGSAGFLSLLLVAAASLTVSLVMLRGGIFSRAASVVGIAASGLDLAYCLAFLFAPAVDGALLAVTFIPAAGLFWMVWHILVGWRLYRLGRAEPRLVAKPVPGQ